jgi:hypothetical protein
MDAVLGIDSVNYFSTVPSPDWARLRAMIFVEKLHSNKSLDWNFYAQPQLPTVRSTISQEARERFDGLGFILDEDDHFCDVCTFLEERGILTFGETTDSLVLHRKSQRDGDHDDDAAALAEDIQELVERMRADDEEEDDPRQISFGGQNSMLQPRGSTMRLLARGDRADKASRRSASGSRAVGDSERLDDDATDGMGARLLGGHAAEFVGWCKAHPGELYNGVELSSTKEVRLCH